MSNKTKVLFGLALVSVGVLTLLINFFVFDSSPSVQMAYFIGGAFGAGFVLIYTSELKPASREPASAGFLFIIRIIR